MLKEHSAMQSVIDTVQNKMSTCMNKLEDRAILRNLTSLAPELNNATLWSPKYSMFKRFNQIKYSLIEVL